MPKPQLITALDLGSDTIKMAVAQRRTGRTPRLLALEKEPSWGIRKGVIVDPEKVAGKIGKILQRVQLVTNKKIREVTCNINGSHLSVAPSKGVVAVSRADQQISQEDIDRVIAAAQAFSLPSNKEILEVFPREFTVDSEKQIKDPLGMKGIRLEAEVLTVCCFSPYLKNLTQALSLADLDILDIIPSGLAVAKAVLGARQKELGVCSLDIGAWTTNLAVFEEGDLVHLAVFPIGSGHITNDIAIGLQTDIDTAERIKIEFGDCLYQRKGKPEKIEISQSDLSRIEVNHQEMKTASKEYKRRKLSSAGGSRKKNNKDALVFSRKFLIKIIEARIAEIFSEVQKELKKIGKAKLLPAGIILTGGGAKLRNINELAKREFKLPCQLGFPKGIEGIERDASLAAITGLLLENTDSIEQESRFAKTGFLSKIKRMFRIFVP